MTESHEQPDAGPDEQGHPGNDPDPEGVEPNVPRVNPEEGEKVLPGEGGYGGRDPKTDMPAMPSVPESQDDKMSHDAAPDPDSREREPTE